MVKEEEVIILTDKERDSLLETFQHPPKPNEALKNLFKGTERKMAPKEQNEKQSKILDILKNKEVCIQMLKHILELGKKDVLEYGYTEEEYDLLKEWLNEKNEKRDYKGE